MFAKTKSQTVIDTNLRSTSNDHALAGAQTAATPYVGNMTSVLAILLAIAMLCVLGVLGAGMLGLVQGSANPRRSNALMRARVLLQGICLVLLALLLLSRHS